MKNLLKIVITLALIVGASTIYSVANGIFANGVFATEALPTITMGDNAPMTRDEFMAWREQQEIRYIDIDGQIVPPGIFFNGYSGKAFRYGEVDNRVLPVYLIAGAVSNAVNPCVNVAPATALSAEEVPQAPNTTALAEEAPQTPIITAPIIFDDLTPILFTDEELTAMIDSVPNANPLEATSAITLPNRKLTEAELGAWIADYNEIGGATAFELGVIREINRARVQHGVQPLALNPALMLSSRLKTQEFADLQYYSHRSPVHGTVRESALMLGYNGAVGEATGRIGSSGEANFFTTPERIVAGMLASTRGHRELLLSPRLYCVGFGASFSPNSRGANGNMSHMFYFVTQFGFIMD
ncbi:MAG: CAP domain-containing protein [Defluviitaleaceae bacterium]|nr:CAP domain-containing protein [Defluviitaleaceae bacterium]